MQTTQPVGGQLRDWRRRRRLSQLDLSLDAEISPRHLSFLETGRSLPSRAMLLRLAERLDIPLRERNVLLTAAGYAPVFPQRPWTDPALAAARRALDLVLRGHEPFPALVIDRHWTLIAANRAVTALIGDVDPELLAPPVNVLRLSVHPKGLAPRIVNLAEWHAHLTERLRRQAELTADPALAALLDELAKYRPARDRRFARGPADHPFTGVYVPLQIEAGGRQLSLFSTTTVFGTPVDITLAELALEAFYPADEATAEGLRKLVDASSRSRQG